VSRSAIDLEPAEQRTYLVAFSLVAQHLANGGSVVLTDEISRRTMFDSRTTRSHLQDLGRDLLDVDVTDDWHLCVRGLFGKETPTARLG
jgi:hypothetical protein